MMTKFGQQGPSHQVKVLEVPYYFPLSGFQGNGKHIDDNEQVAQHVDVFRNLFHVVPLVYSVLAIARCAAADIRRAAGLFSMPV
jgi:hypothetical protein